ncbi:hypothetical protein H4S02_002496 [Coemansia sp. RSA 2611]|nr:hypothetical protein H4S02_002496 [Coemansia sp. RSA 2611]
MSIGGTHAQLQRQLYLLGYSQTLPEDGVPLVSMLLKDMQASLDRVKELEQNAVKLERDERTSRAGSEKLRGELHALRTENNSMRTEVLNYTRELDAMRREARSDAYATRKAADDLRLENLRVRAECAETRRQLDGCQQRLEAELAERDPGGRVSRIASNEPLHIERRAVAPPAPAPAIVDLVDLSSRRINALEEEIEHLEAKLRTTQSELGAAQLEVKERDLEIHRLNGEFAGRARGTGDGGADTEARLNDQIDYLHERAETLERQAREQREQFAREKDELHRRWVHTENERVRLAGSASSQPLSQPLSQPSPQPSRQSSPHSPPSPAEAERLRAECANIKSLYAQTRDQLQELLRANNADARQAREQAAGAEAALRQELDQLRASTQARIAELEPLASDAAAFKELAQARDREIAQLTDRARDGDAQAAELKTQVAELTAQAAELKTQGDARRAQLEAAQREHAQLVEQHRAVDRSLAQAVREVGELTKVAGERSHRIAALTRQCDEHRMAASQAGAELRSCRRALDSYSSDLATLRAAHAAAQADADRLRDELAQAVRLRRAVELSKDDHKRQLLRALAENESHRALADHLHAERRALRVQVKAQFHLSQRLEQRLEALDPSYAHEPMPALADLPPPHPRLASRTSSAAHSARSFDAAVPDPEGSASSISLP